MSSEHLVRSADGLGLFVREWPATAPQAALPVLCLHGFTRSSRDFEDVAPRLAAGGRRVLALDVRGRGRSDRDPRPERYELETYAADVETVLDALGAPRAVFLGTSMGAAITWTTAARAPSRVAAAILNDAGPVVNLAGLARIVQYIGRTGPFPSWAALVEDVKANYGAMLPHADDARWLRFARRSARELADGRVELDYDPALARAFAPPKPGVTPPDPKAQFATMAAIPVLVLRGAKSDILTAAGVAAMRELKPDVEVVEISDVGHAPTLDEPEAIAAVSRFLAKLP
jgi:pimeloyl-ACP methyl ester carboxylesterase